MGQFRVAGHILTSDSEEGRLSALAYGAQVREFVTGVLDIPAPPATALYADQADSDTWEV